MRNPKRGLFLLGLFALIAAALAFSTVGSSAAESAQRAANQVAEVELTLSVSPLSIEPGQEARVSIVLKNISSGPLAPEVLVSLPASVSTKLQELPTATIYNAQNGTVSWQPVLPGAGAEVQLSLPIMAMVADVNMPEQIVSATARVGDQEIRQEASFWIGLAPSASIRPNPPLVAVGQPIQLFGTVSGPGPVAQLWSLGDGRIVEAQDPVVVYPAPGVYEVILQASTPIGVVTSSHMVTIVAQPISRFSVADPMPAAGHSVNFINESGGQPPLSYLWDFGDGTTSSETSPSHSYYAPGPHEVRLVVSGSNGVSESIQTIVVGQAPVADFVIGEIADAGSVIQAQAFTDDTATSIRWDMGDGRSHEGHLIEHVYWSAGDYLVTVTITNEFGETVIQRGLRINAGPLYLYLPLIENTSAAVFDAQITVEPELQSDPPGQNEPVTTKEELNLLDLPEELSPAEQLLVYINEARRINGLLPLNHVQELSVAAQYHADDMALQGFTSHTGSDGTVPALRVRLSGYPGGYAGEATAWGMSAAVEPVKYWLTSPAHREIILNPAATDVGVGFSENYGAANVWYWTAEFASLDLPVIHVSMPAPTGTSPPPEPVIDLLGPPRDSAFLLSPDTNLIFTWSWPVPLSSDERFAIYVNSDGRTIQLGTVTQSQSENQYHFSTSAASVPVAPGQQQWFIQLEDTLQGSMRDQSESWPINFLTNPE